MAITAVHSASAYDMTINDGKYLNKGQQKSDIDGAAASQL